MAARIFSKRRTGSEEREAERGTGNGEFCEQTDLHRPQTAGMHSDMDCSTTCLRCSTRCRLNLHNLPASRLTKTLVSTSPFLPGTKSRQWHLRRTLSHHFGDVWVCQVGSSREKRQVWRETIKRAEISECGQEILLRSEHDLRKLGSDQLQSLQNDSAVPCFAGLLLPPGPLLFSPHTSQNRWNRSWGAAGLRRPARCNTRVRRPRIMPQF